MSKITSSEYYPALLDRLAHLETLRHGVLGVQLAIAGAFVGQFFTKDTTSAFQENCAAALWISIISLQLLEIMAHNLFAKSMRAATELMIVEYTDELVKKGIGYFSFRKQRSRTEYWVSGMASEVLIVIFAVAFLILAKTHLSSDSQLVAGVFCFVSIFYRFKTVSDIFIKKDSTETECQKKDDEPLETRLYKLRTKD